MPELITKTHDHTYAIQGAVNFSNVLKLREQGFNAILEHNELIIDFSQTASSSSALVALLIGWLRYAVQNNKKLQYKALPEAILDIIKISSLSKVLPIV